MQVANPGYGLVNTTKPARHNLTERGIADS